MSDATTFNVLHAAAVWLQRSGAVPTASAVVTFLPRAAVGVRAPGADSADMQPSIDEAGADLCDAAAPWLQEAREQLGARKLQLLEGAIRRGATLEALLSPSANEAVLRVTHGRDVVVLCTVHLLGDEVH